MTKAGKVPCALLLAAICLLPGRAEEEAPAELASTVPIEVTLTIPEPVIHRELSRAELEKLAGNGEKEGLTRLSLEVAHSIDAVFWETPEPSFRVTRLEVKVGYRSIDIYVAREHREETCAYAQVLAHEREHVRADRELVEEYVRELEAVLRALDLPSRKKPWRVSSSQAGRRRVEAVSQAVLQRLDKELKRKREEASRALDRATDLQYEIADCERDSRR